MLTDQTSLQQVSVAFIPVNGKVVVLTARSNLSTQPTARKRNTEEETKNNQLPRLIDVSPVQIDETKSFEQTHSKHQTAKQPNSQTAKTTVEASR
jgi:hypothetical protein